jgi:hypothetical protein
MTTYLDIISLEQAKIYLKVDSGQTETDDEITSMINSSLSFIEKRTNHIFKTREKVYYKDCSLVQQVKVYDFPIQEAPTDTTVRPLYSIVPTVNDTVTLTIGYILLDDIPNELIDAALQIIKVWFYESEKQENTSLIPLSVLQAIDANRRFL